MLDPDNFGHPPYLHDSQIPGQGKVHTHPILAMKRHEVWRLQYRSRRYMEHLSDDEVRQRARDVFLNLLVITEEAKIGLPPINPESSYWMELWTHVLEEFALRFGPYPQGIEPAFISEAGIPLPSDPRMESAAAVVARRGLTQGTYLVKYGELTHLQQAYEFGRIRIAPASTYTDPSLNPAIRDRELEIDIQPPPPEIHLDVFDPKTGIRKGSVTPTRSRITTASRTDYYVYCMSRLFTPRLFFDFNYNACLLITRLQEFTDAIVSQFESRLPDFTGLVKAVHYIDPLNTTLGDMDVFFCKHFRFAYQREVRCVWLPLTLRTDLQPICLELGSLSSLAELISLAEV